MNREIFHIAIPAIVTNVTIPLLGLLDTAIAGHLPGGSGATFISAVAVGAMMFNLIYWNFGFLRMGTSGLTAQAYGSGDKAETVAVLQHAMALGFLISVGIIVLQWPLQWVTLLAIGPSDTVRQLALTYFYIGVWGAPPTLVMMGIKGWLLGMQDSRSPMVISIAVNVLNIVLSVIAVFALGLGFTGIIVGTVLAEWIGLAYSLWLLRRKYRSHVAAMDWRKAFGFKGSARFFKVNSHIFIRSTLMMLQALFFTAAGARSGDMTLAVNTLILQMAILFSYFMDGIAFAGEAIAGKYYGRGDVAAEHSCVWLGWSVYRHLHAAVCHFSRTDFHGAYQRPLRGERSPRFPLVVRCDSRCRHGGICVGRCVYRTHPHSRNDGSGGHRLGGVFPHIRRSAHLNGQPRLVARLHRIPRHPLPRPNRAIPWQPVSQQANRSTGQQVSECSEYSECSDYQCTHKIP